MEDEARKRMKEAAAALENALDGAKIPEHLNDGCGNTFSLNSILKAVTYSRHKPGIETLKGIDIIGTKEDEATYYRYKPGTEMAKTFHIELEYSENGSAGEEAEIGCYKHKWGKNIVLGLSEITREDLDVRESMDSVGKGYSLNISSLKNTNNHLHINCLEGARDASWQVMHSPARYLLAPSYVLTWRTKDLAYPVGQSAIYLTLEGDADFIKKTFAVLNLSP